MDQLALRERLTSAYAAGALDPALCLLMETQAAVSDVAAEDLALAECLAGAVFEAEIPIAMGAGALDRALAALPARVKETAKPIREAARAAGAVIEEILHLPKPVRDLALDAIGAGGWTFAGPGIRSLPLNLPGPAQAEILRIEPGWGAPRHTHKGGEYTLVMSGAFHDERGIYYPGDIAVAGPGVFHRPTAERGEVCYSLAVTEAPLEFTGALGFIQKLLRH